MGTSIKVLLSSGRDQSVTPSFLHPHSLSKTKWATGTNQAVRARSISTAFPNCCTFITLRMDGSFLHTAVLKAGADLVHITLQSASKVPKHLLLILLFCLKPIRFNHSTEGETVLPNLHNKYPYIPLRFLPVRFYYTVEEREKREVDRIGSGELSSSIEYAIRMSIKHL